MKLHHVFKGTTNTPGRVFWSSFELHSLFLLSHAIPHRCVSQLAFNFEDTAREGGPIDTECTFFRTPVESGVCESKKTNKTNCSVNHRTPFMCKSPEQRGQPIGRQQDGHSDRSGFGHILNGHLSKNAAIKEQPRRSGHHQRQRHRNLLPNSGTR